MIAVCSAMAFATLCYGSLSDRYGRRPVLLSGLALFLVGSVLSALAQTAATLFFGRLIQAIGAGVGLPLVRAIARDAYRADQLIKAIAYLTMSVLSPEGYCQRTMRVEFAVVLIRPPGADRSRVRRL